MIWQKRSRSSLRLDRRIEDRLSSRNVLNGGISVSFELQEHVGDGMHDRGLIVHGLTAYDGIARSQA